MCMHEVVFFTCVCMWWCCLHVYAYGGVLNLHVYACGGVLYMCMHVVVFLTCVCMWWCCLRVYACGGVVYMCMHVVLFTCIFLSISAFSTADANVCVVSF